MTFGPDQNAPLPGTIPAGQFAEDDDRTPSDAENITMALHSIASQLGTLITILSQVIRQNSAPAPQQAPTPGQQWQPGPRQGGYPQGGYPQQQSQGQFQAGPPAGNGWICPEHGQSVYRQGGVSRTSGRPYPAFFACPTQGCNHTSDRG